MDRRAASACLALTMACSMAPSESERIPPTILPDAGFVAGQDPATRLRRGLADRPDIQPSARNPFRFKLDAESNRSAGNPRGGGQLPAADGLPMLPLPLAQPPLRLLGLITMADGKRVVALSVGSDLIIAATNDVIVSRFRVGEIRADSVDLTDTIGDRPIRLALP